MSKTGAFVAAAAGIDFEARIAGAVSNVAVACGQGEVLANRLRDVARDDCVGIISFGIAGGLDPSLTVGQAIVASEAIVTSEAAGGAQRFPADARWAAFLVEAYAGAVTAPIVTVQKPVRSAEDKARLFAKTKAAAVDMESAVAASIAAERGLAFATFRVIADEADFAVPQAAIAGLRRDGRTAPLAVLSALAKAPNELPGLFELARASAKARRALIEATALFGRGFGLLDLS